MIIRTQKTNKYTTLSNTAGNDTRLSNKARGIYYHLMTKPDNWKITVEGIVAQSKDGRDAISAGLKELGDCGYLVREKSRAPDGTFEYDATLYEEPRPENPELDNPTQVNTIKVNTNTTTKVVGATHEVLEGEIVTDVKHHKARTAVDAEVIEDSDREEVPPARTGREDINNVIEAFEKTFELKLTRMPKQRIAASNLIRRYTELKVLGAIQYAGSIRDDTYAPQILSLEDLWAKWDKLGAYYRKQNTQATTGVTVITEE